MIGEMRWVAGGVVGEDLSATCRGVMSKRLYFFSIALTKSEGIAKASIKNCVVERIIPETK